MPPHEVACKLLKFVLTQDWPRDFDTSPAEVISGGQRRDEVFFALELPSAESDPGYGRAIIRHSDSGVAELIAKDKPCWLSLHQYPGNLAICGVWAAEEDKEPKPFAINMSLPPDWDYGRQLIHVSHLLTNPYVPLTSSPSSREVARLYLRMALELVKQYPWRGGLIQGTSTEVSARSVQVSNALQFIRQFLHLPLNRIDVANAVGVSESYLTALLKEGFDTNVTDYMLLERILRADAMLIRGSLPVATIGRLCGFSSTTYFIRAYRKQRIMTPLRVRKWSTGTPKDHDWSERLFHFEDFVRLKPSARPTPVTPETDQRMLLIANTSENILDVERQDAQGDGYAPLPSIGPMEIQLHWPPAPSTLRLTREGQVLSQYRTTLEPCQILVYRDA